MGNAEAILIILQEWKQWSFIRNQIVIMRNQIVIMKEKVLQSPRDTALVYSVKHVHNIMHYTGKFLFTW